jgi:hypothetical protein
MFAPQREGRLLDEPRPTFRRIKVSVLDKVIAAVTPPESEEARKEARAKAQAAATPGDWLATILEHHRQIEAAFAAVRAANRSASRLAAQKQLGILLTGHANAEETVLYPALTTADEKGHAAMAYTEQAAARTQMALLENLAPMSQDYVDKLEHIRGAVAHHMYEEEGTWFLELKEKIPAADQSKLTARYLEEFERYVGSEDESPAWASTHKAQRAQ